MAELSGFWTTGGTVGDQAASYTQANWSTAAQIFAACSGFEGVAPGYLNALAGTVTGANTVAINTGGGLVDGKWFINDASQNVTIPSASGGGNTRIDRIVLRATWASFNVSVTRIAGTDAASPTAPAITQTSGTTYDILLYRALVDTAGTVTITDERTMAAPLYIRQGGHASAWATAGTTNRAVNAMKMQAGSVTWTGSASTGDAKTVTLPASFSGAPLAFASVYRSGAAPNVSAEVEPSTTELTIHWLSIDGTTTYTELTFYWLAIGI